MSIHKTSYNIESMHNKVQNFNLLAKLKMISDTNLLSGVLQDMHTAKFWLTFNYCMSVYIPCSSRESSHVVRNEKPSSILIRTGLSRLVILSWLNSPSSKSLFIDLRKRRMTLTVGASTGLLSVYSSSSAITYRCCKERCNCHARMHVQ